MSKKNLSRQEKKAVRTARARSQERRRQLLAAFGLDWLPAALKILKYLFLFVLFVVVPVIGLVLLALQCRRNDEAWVPFRKYRYAHRGLHRKGLPENSMAAFRDALDHGYGIELDLHLMKDGNLAVVHDSKLGRMCGADAVIEDLTAEDLPKLKLDYTEETIPLFENVLELFNHRPEPMIVELKVANGNHNELAAKAMELLDRYDVKYVVESFDPRAIAWLRANRPEVLRGQLSTALTKPEHGGSGEKQLSLMLVEHLFTNILAQPDFIAYDFTERNIPELQICRKVYHVQEVSWTIRTPEDAAAAEKLGNLVIFENFGW